MDDDPGILSAFSRLLGRAGFEVETATDAAEARVALDRSRFDVVLSDYSMPRESGLELLMALRAAGSRVAFVLMTATPTDEVLARAAALGVARVLTKPLAEGALLDALPAPCSEAVCGRCQCGAADGR